MSEVGNENIASIISPKKIDNVKEASPLKRKNEDGTQEDLETKKARVDVSTENLSDVTETSMEEDSGTQPTTAEKVMSSEAKSDEILSEELPPKNDALGVQEKKAEEKETSDIATEDKEITKDVETEVKDAEIRGNEAEVEGSETEDGNADHTARPVQKCRDQAKKVLEAAFTKREWKNAAETSKVLEAILFDVKNDTEAEFLRAVYSVAYNIVFVDDYAAKVESADREFDFSLDVPSEETKTKIKDKVESFIKLDDAELDFDSLKVSSQ